MRTYSSRQRWQLPLLLYIATWFTAAGFRIDSGLLYHFCVSVFLFPMNSELSGNAWAVFKELLWLGTEYSVPLMLLLTCHELGHYIQTRRYGIQCSLPFFIPMPFGPLGTMGAVIAMDGRIPNRRALFDIGISGPLAGLVPTVFFLYYGIKWSHFGPSEISAADITYNEPLLFKLFSYWIFGPVPGNMTMYAHPLAMAGWVGLLLTSLNLMPFSQLDGGHVFYAMVGKNAGKFSTLIFYALILLVVWFHLWHWTLMLILLAYIGVTHPPTGNDTLPLTPFRYILGWLTLAFVFIGFTPSPIALDKPQPQEPPKMYCVIDKNTGN
ncbi:MAG: site-2 protease family protein [Planctomycetaceae bacterium]|jgi:Zn-dependent protease|nr:site-2 protease family protein [Planctomycetaceae bacterium]